MGYLLGGDVSNSLNAKSVVEVHDEKDKYHRLFVWHEDIPGVFGKVGTVLGNHGVNIGYEVKCRFTKRQKGETNYTGTAMAVYLLDDKPTETAVQDVNNVKGVIWAKE